MRAIDILLLCLCINAAISFLDVSGAAMPFSGKSTGYMVAQTGQVWAKELTGINAFKNEDPASTTAGDMFMVAASWVIETSFFAIGFIISAAFIIPALMTVFQFPGYLAVMLQGLIYYIYLWAYLQWKGGKSLFSYW